METMHIFEDGTEPMMTAGALDGDQLPLTTMTFHDNDNGFNHKVGRTDDDESTTNDPTATTAMATPAEQRNDTANAMASMGNAVGDATSATSTTMTTSVAPTARLAQFCDQPV